MRKPAPRHLAKSLRGPRKNPRKASCGGNDERGPRPRLSYRAASAGPDQQEWSWCPHGCRRWFKGLVPLQQHLHDVHALSWEDAKTQASTAFRAAEVNLGKMRPRTPERGPARRSSPARDYAERPPVTVDPPAKSSGARDRSRSPARSPLRLQPRREQDQHTVLPEHSASQVGGLGGPASSSAAPGFELLGRLLAVSERLLSDESATAAAALGLGSASRVK